MKQFTGIATIQYDPHRGHMQRRTQWWCVAEVDTEITRYCRWWLRTARHIHLQPPAWDAHISIVRGERPSQEHQALWKRFHGKRLNFKYDHFEFRVQEDINNGGEFYWIDVECPQMDQIRAELGLRTGFRYHLTIGRTYEYEARTPKASRK